jgi:hypothetical protein
LVHITILNYFQPFPHVRHARVFDSNTKCTGPCV